MLKLRVEREARGWTLREVARFTNISPGIYSLVEWGKYPCYPAWRTRLERLFRVDSEQLLTADTSETRAE